MNFDAGVRASSCVKSYATGESSGRWWCGTNPRVVALALASLALTLTVALLHTQHSYSFSPIPIPLSHDTSPLSLFSSSKATELSSSSQFASRNTTLPLSTLPHTTQPQTSLPQTSQPQTSRPLKKELRSFPSRELLQERGAAPLNQCSDSVGPCTAKTPGNEGTGLGTPLDPDTRASSRKDLGRPSAAPGSGAARWKYRNSDSGRATTLFAGLVTGVPRAHPAFVESGGNDYNSCSAVRLAPPNKQCELAEALCKSLSGDTLLDYMSLHYCSFRGQSWVSVPLYALGLLLAFYLLADTAESFFCPTVTILSDMLHLAPNTAGVTLLALGNGAPDLSGAIASFTTGDPHIAMGAILRYCCWRCSSVAQK